METMCMVVAVCLAFYFMTTPLPIMSHALAMSFSSLFSLDVLTSWRKSLPTPRMRVSDFENGRHLKQIYRVHFIRHY